MLRQGEEQSHNWRKGQRGGDPGDSNVTLAAAFHPFPSPPAELSPPWHGQPLSHRGTAHGQHGWTGAAVTLPRTPGRCQHGTGATKPISAPTGQACGPKPSPKPLHTWIEGERFARRTKTPQSHAALRGGQGHPQHPHFGGECSQGSQRRLRGRKTHSLTPQPHDPGSQAQQQGGAGGCGVWVAPQSPSPPLPPRPQASAGQRLGGCSAAPACRSQPRQPVLVFSWALATLAALRSLLFAWCSGDFQAAQ